MEGPERARGPEGYAGLGPLAKLAEPRLFQQYYMDLVFDDVLDYIDRGKVASNPGLMEKIISNALDYAILVAGSITGDEPVNAWKIIAKPRYGVKGEAKLRFATKQGGDRRIEYEIKIGMKISLTTRALTVWVQISTPLEYNIEREEAIKTLATIGRSAVGGFMRALKRMRVSTI